MATRKQLSDVLREEANKSSTPETESKAEDWEQSNQAKASKPTSTKPASKTGQSASQPAAQSKKPKTSEALDPSVVVTALDGETDDLRTALDDARMREGVLQRKIDALESDLDKHRTLVQQLTTDLEQAKHSKAELDEAKRVIVQLSELNSNLAVAAKASKLAQVTPQAAEPSAPPQVAKSPATPPPAATNARTVHPGHTTSQRSQIELHRMFDHPVLPAPSSTSLSDDEIGWVD